MLISREGVIYLYFKVDQHNFVKNFIIEHIFKFLNTFLRAEIHIDATIKTDKIN